MTDEYMQEKELPPLRRFPKENELQPTDLFKPMHEGKALVGGYDGLCARRAWARATQAAAQPAAQDTPTPVD